jgi:secreted trypsin-like serine protease
MSQITIFASFFFTIYIVEAIIGGESVLNPHEFPWVVGVRTESGKCGGTIITKNLIMTAAHCLFNSKKEFNKAISVLMGHSDISSTLIKKERVQSVLVHPQQRKTKYYNDVALLRLSKDLLFDNTVQPIALSNDDITGDLLLLCNKEIGFRI